MRVQRLAWLGVRAAEFEEMVRFLRDVMGLRVEFAHDSTTELTLPNDDRVQVFGPGHNYYDFFGEHAVGPVAPFEIDDVHEAEPELTALGVQMVGSIEADDVWEWLHFKAPDGNLYAVASRRVATG